MIYLYPVIAVVLSFVLVWISRPKSGSYIKLLLAFSGAFLLALTFFELLPQIYQNIRPKEIAVYILAGILLQIFLEFFSKGAEHGHMHLDIKKNHFPFLLFVSLSIHALVEGLPIVEGNPILYAILIHKIPVALILSIFLLNSDLKRGYTLLFILLFALMTPLGSYIALETALLDDYGMQATALSIGIFLHISTVILFETSQHHSFNLQKLIVIILGITIAYFL